MSRKRAQKAKEFTPIWDRPSLKPKNSRQLEYMNAILNHNVIVGTGVAGSGKTYMASVMAADMLEDSRTKINKIIIARPNEIEGTKSIGFLKGSLTDKMMPLVAPVVEAIKHRMGPTKFKYLLEAEIIEFLPLEYIKGRSFDNTFVIIDEAEDIEWSILKTLMLRVGRDSKVVIDGDVRQTSISSTSGLQQLMDLNEEYHLPICFVDFDEWKYCVRSAECRLFGEIFEDARV